jgi:hypothetical protein
MLALSMGLSQRIQVALLVLTLAAAALAHDPHQAQDQPGTPSLTPAQWHEDLVFLTTKVEQMHPPSEKIKAFTTAAQELDGHLPRLSRDEAIVRIMEVGASLHDGHTTVMPRALQALGMRVLPMRFYLYRDGTYLQAADRKYQAVVGGKLIRIGDTPIEEALAKVGTTIGHDNEETVRDRLPAYMIYPDVLAGLQIIHKTDRVPLTFEVNGRATVVEVEAVKPPAVEGPPGFDVAYSSDWIDSASVNPVPLWLKNPHKSYWMEFVPESGTLYVQYNQCTSDPQNPMPKFAEQMQHAAAEPSVKRVVLDLRLNSGGEGYWNKFLLLSLIRATSIDQPGKLFAITGRHTFSAGNILALDLERFTHAVRVGEPTGGAVQNFGNHEPVTLPNSKLMVMVATAFYQNNGPHDKREWIAPEVSADLTQSDYAEGKDPAMAAIASYVPASERLVARVKQVAPQEARASYEQFHQESVNRYAEFETILNSTGYELLHEGDTARAVEVFRIATEEFPGSANAFDSLGDAYLAAGEKKLAVASYTQALKINPQWEPSRRSLERLNENTSASR